MGEVAIGRGRADDTSIDEGSRWVCVVWHWSTSIWDWESCCWRNFIISKKVVKFARIGSFWVTAGRANDYDGNADGLGRERIFKKVLDRAFFFMLRELS
ncbi:hypothetical protein ACLOJK_027658 [Asimina triloba]